LSVNTLVVVFNDISVQYDVSIVPNAILVFVGIFNCAFVPRANIKLEGIIPRAIGFQVRPDIPTTNVVLAGIVPFA